MTAKDAKGHAARIAKEIPMFKKIIEEAEYCEALAENIPVNARPAAAHRPRGPFDFPRSRSEPRRDV